MKISIKKNNIIITNGVSDILNKYRQVKNKSKENGGILLGQVNKEHILISRASLPSSLDKSFPFNFIRSKNSAQYIIDYEFHNSRKKNIYLGEWHSHPENNANPSRQDISMIKEQFTSNKINTGFLIFIIIGIKKDFIGIYNGKKIESITTQIQ